MDKKEIYIQALRNWGYLQKVVAIEEMTELQKELSKNMRGEENELYIAEEIADVEIMLEQMKILFNIDEDVEEMKEYKIKRLAEGLGV